MTDLRQRIFDAVEQPRFDLEPGILVIRGVRIVIILAVEDDRVWWQDEDGTTERGTLNDFWGRAVQMVPFPEFGNWLDRAWQIAGATGIPATSRILALRKALRRAPDPESEQALVRWMADLSAGREPRK